MSVRLFLVPNTALISQNSAVIKGAVDTALMYAAPTSAPRLWARRDMRFDSRNDNAHGQKNKKTHKTVSTKCLETQSWEAFCVNKRFWCVGGKWYGCLGIERRDGGELGWSRREPAKKNNNKKTSTGFVLQDGKHQVRRPPSGNALILYLVTLMLSLNQRFGSFPSILYTIPALCKPASSWLLIHVQIYVFCKSFINGKLSQRPTDCKLNLPSFPFSLKVIHPQRRPWRSSTVLHESNLASK